MEIKAFFDSTTSTLSYIVYDGSSKDALIIDPVLNYEPASSTLTTQSIKEMIQFIRETKLEPQYVLETHAHADHLSASQKLKEFFPGLKVAINERIVKVQQVFKKVYHLEKEFPTDGSQFDKLLSIGENYKFGTLSLDVLATPGHTPACTSFLMDGLLFTGDALFMPDYGTGRCDFPAGSAEDLYHSVTQKLYTLSDDTRVFVGHDYQPGGRELQFESTIGDEKAHNIRLNQNTSKEEFVSFRKERDATLSAPNLLYPSVQVNIRAGHLPEPESNGKNYLKIPLEMG